MGDGSNGKTVGELQDCIEDLLAQLARERKLRAEFEAWLGGEVFNASKHCMDSYSMYDKSRVLADVRNEWHELTSSYNRRQKAQPGDNVFVELRRH